MGKAGKRHEMVKRTYERLACERAACMSVCVSVCVYVCMYVCCTHACMHGWMDGWMYACMYVCMCALCGDAQNMPHAMTIGERQAALAVEAAQPDLFHTSGLQPKQGHGKWHRGWCAGSWTQTARKPLVLLLLWPAAAPVKVTVYLAALFHVASNFIITLLSNS